MKMHQDVLKYRVLLIIYIGVLTIYIGVSLEHLLYPISILEKMFQSFSRIIYSIEPILIRTLYPVGIVITCGFALIFVILKQAVLEVDSEGSLKQGFRSLGIYIYLGIFELFKELFNKKTLKVLLWLIGLSILVVGFANLIGLLLM